MPVTPWVLGGRAEQLPRLTHRPLVPTCSVTHSYCTVCKSPPGIWGGHIVLFLKDVLMYPGAYNYCLIIIAQNRCWFGVTGAVAAAALMRGLDTTCAV